MMITTNNTKNCVITDKITEFYNEFHRDQDFRNAIQGAIKTGNSDFIENYFRQVFAGEVILKADTDDIIYFIIPNYPNRALTEEEISANITGAKANNDKYYASLSLTQAQAEIDKYGWFLGFGALIPAEGIKRVHPEYFYDGSLIIKNVADYNRDINRS